MYLTRHHKRARFRRLRIAVYAVVISLFFVPSFISFKSTGENIFTVYVNGTSVGTVESPMQARKMCLQARKNVNASSSELTFAEVSLTTEGREILWGKVDDPETVISNMENVIRSGIKDNFCRAFEVKINGYVVTLATKDEVVRLLQAAISKYDPKLNFLVSLASDETRELPVLIPKVNTLAQALEEEETKAALSLSAGIDSELTAACNEMDTDQEMDFEDYKLGIMSMGFADPIEVVEVYTKGGQLTDVETAIKDVTEEELQNEIYKVVSGDTLSGIALKVDIPIDDIIAMNDSLEDQSSLIRPDDELIITVPKPKLSVIRVEEMYYEENYTAPTEYILNDAWYTTDRKVHQQPSDGHRKAVSLITFKNDEKIDTEIIKEEITYMPVAKIVEKGTKIPPSYIKPIYGGRLTSPFGYRKRPTKGASSYHKGIDWGTPVGTPVYASCGGTVVKAGWGSGYGNVVYINHPDGKQTRYGHLSRVLVSAGQSVSQGQKIALSGNTGVSTGPHVHFEVLSGGTAINPLKLIGG